MPIAVQGTCCQKWLLHSSGCSHILPASWGSWRDSSFRAGRSPGENKTVMREGKSSLGEMQWQDRLLVLSQPPLFILHCTVSRASARHSPSMRICGAISHHLRATSSKSLAWGFLLSVSQTKSDLHSQACVKDCQSSPCRRNPTQVHPPAPCRAPQLLCQQCGQTPPTHPNGASGTGPGATSTGMLCPWVWTLCYCHPPEDKSSRRVVRQP